MQVGFSGDFLEAPGKPVFPSFGLDVLDAASVPYRILERFDPEYSSEQLKGLDVILTLKPRVTRESLQGNEDRLIGVGRYGVGYDNVDLAACTDANICVYITPEAVVRPMASTIVLFVLALSHNLVWKDKLVRQGRWKESIKTLGIEPRERVVGTIGFGNIASAAFKLLRGFDIGRFLACDPFVSAERAAELGVELVSMDRLLRESDYVLVNCPLTPQTRGLVGEREFQLMKPGAFFINTARGPIVDQAALIRVLQENRIRGAALDVFEQEPLPDDSPLTKLENVVLTSHSLGWTEQLFRDMGRDACGGAIALGRGEVPRHVVNREVLEKPEFRSKLQRLAAGRIG